jgi:hypothetical protein
MNLKTQNKLSRFGILFLTVWLCVLTTACPAPCDVEGKEVGQLQTEGAPIVRALESYKAERGGYPENLAALVPQYLSNIPEKLGNRRFFYNRHSANDYTLRVASRNGGFYSGACTFKEIAAKDAGESE